MDNYIVILRVDINGASLYKPSTEVWMSNPIPQKAVDVIGYPCHDLS